MIVSVILFLLLLIVALVLYLRWGGVPRIIWVIAFAAFAIRAGYVFVDTVFNIYAGGGDQRAYDRTFWYIADQWRSGTLLAPLEYDVNPGNTNEYMILYSLIFSPAYVIFGHITILPRLQMALIGTLVVINVYLIGRELFNHRGGLIGSLITAVFPYWIVLSAIIYRDMFVVFFFTLATYYFVRWQSGERSYQILFGMCLAATSGVFLRVENIVAVGALVGTAVFLLLNRPEYRYLATVSVGIGILFIWYALGYGDYLSAEALGRRRLWLARENPGAYLSGYAYDSFIEMIRFAPVGAFYFTFAPFPWHVIDWMAIAAIFQNLFVWYPVVLLSALGFRDILHVPSGSKILLPLVAFSLAGFFAYGLVEGNIGPIQRHRAQFQFVFFILAGVALAKRIQITTVPSGAGQDSSGQHSSEIHY